MVWLALHFPALGLECLDGGRDAPRDAPGGATAKAVRVLIEDSRVHYADAAARAAGIRPGCTLATASSIAPGLRHLLRDRSRERQRLEQLAATLYTLSSRISLVPPRELVLEASGSLRLFGGLDNLRARAAALCRELGHEVQLATAATPLKALLLARSGLGDIRQVPLTATLLAGDLTPAQVERLANMGMQRLGPLLDLPDRALARRFGGELVDYLARLSGERPDPRPAFEPPAHFHSSLHLLDVLNSKEALGFVMQRLAGEFGHWLTGRQLAVERLCWTFAPADSRQGLTLPVRFARAQQRKAALMTVSRLALDRAELPADVSTVRLESQRLVPWEDGSRSLFQALPGQAACSDPDDLLDQLRARLGQDACHGIRGTRQHGPEWAWRRSLPRLKARMRPGRASAGSAAVDSAAAGEAAPAPDRPLWLFDPPRLTERRLLTLLHGPERIQTGWWQRPLRRDYYVARHQNGAECWAFVDHQERWFLHGYFA